MDLDYQDLQKENLKRNYILDTMICQTGALRGCKDELIYQKLQEQLSLGHRQKEQFTDFETQIYEEQTAIAEEKAQAEAENQKKLAILAKKHMQEHLDQEFQQYATTFLY